LNQAPRGHVKRFVDACRRAPTDTGDEQVPHFDVPFTIIRPNYFFQNDLSLKEPLTGAGLYPMPLGTPGISAVDVRDVAEAAAIALKTEGHRGKTYNVVGPNP
jgi:uncharacterized protein YbjT (DUF2867 family)